MYGSGSFKQFSLDLRAAVEEALQTLRLEAGAEPEELFGDRVLEPAEMTARAAHAFGVLEGIGIAYQLTVLELLDLLPGA